MSFPAGEAFKCFLCSEILEISGGQIPKNSFEDGSALEILSRAEISEKLTNEIPVQEIPKILHFFFRTCADSENQKSVSFQVKARAATSLIGNLFQKRSCRDAVREFLRDPEILNSPIFLTVLRNAEVIFGISEGRVTLYSFTEKISENLHMDSVRGFFNDALSSH